METNNNEMDKLYAETFQTISEGSLLSGRVLVIKQNVIIVDIGYKSEDISESMNSQKRNSGL